MVAPAGDSTRPTSDKVREALFNVLANSQADRVLDLFAGTGALALEALSRGATSAVLVESNAQALVAIARNVDACGLAQSARVLRDDVLRVLHRGPDALGAPFDLVLVDPPYRQGLELSVLTALVQRGWLCEGATVVIERATQDLIAWPSELLARFEQAPYEKRYGDTTLVFFFDFALTEAST